VFDPNSVISATILQKTVATVESKLARWNRQTTRNQEVVYPPIPSIEIVRLERPIPIRALRSGEYSASL